MIHESYGGILAPDLSLFPTPYEQEQGILTNLHIVVGARPNPGPY